MQHQLTYTVNAEGTAVKTLADPWADTVDLCASLIIASDVWTRTAAEALSRTWVKFQSRRNRFELFDMESRAFLVNRHASTRERQRLIARYGKIGHITLSSWNSSGSVISFMTRNSQRLNDESWRSFDPYPSNRGVGSTARPCDRYLSLLWMKANMVFRQNWYSPLSPSGNWLGGHIAISLGFWEPINLARKGHESSM